MVKFVPVVDTETPLSERQSNHNPDYDKHRQFDAPHMLQNKSTKKQVDRGWQQGNVGWGVLGSFGSSNKDNAAQVVSKSSGGSKMVRNEKGLWVKAKDVDEGTDRPVSAGRGGGISVHSSSFAGSFGRGGGIPVLPKESETMKTQKSAVIDEFDYNPRHSKSDERYASPDNGRRNDHSDRHNRSRSRSRDRKHDRDSDRNRRDDPDRRHSRRDDDRYDQHRDDRRDSDRRDSRTYDHRRNSSSRGDSRDRRGRDGSRDRDSNRQHSSSSKSYHSDRHSRDDRSSGRTMDDRNNNRDSHRSSKSHSAVTQSSDTRRVMGDKVNRNRDNERNYDAYGHDDEESDNSSVYDESDGGEVRGDENEVDDQTDHTEGDIMVPFVITSIQVVNRLHEMFAKQTLFYSERVESIAELFDEKAVISSLKKESNVYLTGKEAIKQSFTKTTAYEPVISKRVFIDTSMDATNSNATSSSAVKSDDNVSADSMVSNVVTFCLDLHRAGTAPGLGDKTKDTLLLYRCVNAHITTIWGMVDAEHLSSNKDLTDAQLYTSDVWPLVEKVVVRDMPGFSVLKNGHAVYHNYDHMEVWG